MDWNNAYDNGRYVENSAEFVPNWAAKAQEFRNVMAKHAHLDIRYGSMPRQLYDRFDPTGEPIGIVVFVHGGYWHMLDKSYWSHFAQGALELGHRVVIPSYPLAPDARIHEITRSVAQFISHLAQETDLPIRIVGHSAGGHLAARMMCSDVLEENVLAKVVHIAPISGLFDLRVFLQTDMNKKLQLDLAEARSESPALLEARPCEMTIMVGANERPELLRQSKLIANIWQGQSVRPKLIVEPGKNHFDIINCLLDSDSGFMKRFL